MELIIWDKVVQNVGNDISQLMLNELAASILY